jgi:hypothetical protein
MRKITLAAALLVGCFTQAQISTGTIPVTASYAISIDVDATNVAISMEGADDRWMGLGFGVNSMTSGGDVVTFDSTGFNDRAFMGIGVPPVTDTQDWTVISNTATGGIRTVEATRPLAGSDATDFTFDPNASSLDIVWANGVTTTLQNHGAGNRGITTVQFALGIDGVEAQTISLFPIPTTDVLTVSLQNVDVNNATIAIYSALGALVLEQNIDHKSSALDVSSLAKGVYVVKINAASGTLTTRFIKD